MLGCAYHFEWQSIPSHKLPDLLLLLIDYLDTMQWGLLQYGLQYHQQIRQNILCRTVHVHARSVHLERHKLHTIGLLHAKKTELLLLPPAQSRPF
jgi:hypothetical protein